MGYSGRVARQVLPRQPSPKERHAGSLRNRCCVRRGRPVVPVTVRAPAHPRIPVVHDRADRRRALGQPERHRTRACTGAHVRRRVLGGVRGAGGERIGARRVPVPVPIRHREGRRSGGHRFWRAHARDRQGAMALRRGPGRHGAVPELRPGGGARHGDGVRRRLDAVRRPDTGIDSGARCVDRQCGAGCLAPAGVLAWARCAVHTCRGALWQGHGSDAMVGEALADDQQGRRRPPHRRRRAHSHRPARECSPCG